MPATSDAPRILISRLSAIGDVIHGLPVLNALRATYPRAYLTWVVERRAADLLRGHKALDELIELPRGWYQSPRTVWKLRSQLRKLRFDIAIDVQGLSKSALVAWLSGARRRIGFDGRDGREVSRWLNNDRVPASAKHVIDRNLELLRPLGISRPEVRFELADMPDDERFASTLVGCGRLSKRFAVINPGAGWDSKLWPAARFGAVAAELGRRYGVTSLVVWCGDKERAMADEIVAGADGYGLLAPPTTLRQLAAVSRRASLFVGSDTGPLHLAAAVGTACVGLFGPMPGDRNGPYGPQHVIVQRMLLTGRSRDRRNAGPESMEAISVDDVVAACTTIFDRTTSVRRSA